MSESTPTAGGLADRITKPATSTTSWADEVASPTNEESMDQMDGASEAMQGSALHDGEFDVEVKLSDLQADASNPLYSVESFESLGIHENILKGIYSMNFKKPSKIQEKALPLLLSNPPRSMIAQSQSGTGKTAAFVLTILSRIDLTNPTPQALCLAPSRELARQIEGVINTIGQFVEGLKVQAAVPGLIKRGEKVSAHVIVGTPGTVNDWIRTRAFDAKQLKVLCLDEADNMLDQQGLGDQCQKIRLAVHQETQILLFSATFPDEVMKFAQRFAPNANEIKLKHEELTVAGISQMYMDCPSEVGKYEILVKLYGLMTIGSSIIFCKLRTTASEIEKRMIAEGHKVAALHGAYDGAERDAIVDSFRQGHSKVLITTNVLARGIDVQSVSMVINYDVPMAGPPGKEIPDKETYLHRIGRTGRFGRVGVSVSFVYDKQSYQALNEIASFFGIDLVRLSYEDWDQTEDTVQKVIKSSRAGMNFKK